MVINKIIHSSQLDPTYPESQIERPKRGNVADSSSTLIDIVDDLLELKFLVGQLQKNANTINHYNETNRNGELLGAEVADKEITQLKEKLQNHLDTVDRVSSWSNAKDIESILSRIRTDFLKLKAKIREVFKVQGTLLNSSDWQSPIYDSSLNQVNNRLTDNIKEHVLDYKRDGHLDQIEYENSFVSEYMDHLGSKRIKAYLTNSGMAAFTTVLHWLSGELALSKNVLAVTPMYFENIHLLEKFYPEIDQINPENKEELSVKLNQAKPQIVFVDAVTNCGVVKNQNIEAIIEWARSASKETAIVIDTTCIPIALFGQDLLSGLPKHVSVIFVESLAKHHQFGMDMVTGGVIAIDGEESLHKNFKPTRARFGTNISDASASALPLPNKQRLMRRLKRHARNMEMLGQNLETQIHEEKGIIDSLSWVSEREDVPTWYRSPIMSINLCPQFQSVKHYQEFEKRVSELAIEANLPIAFSTSFGFDVSRLYVTAPSTEFEPPFLRLSIGTETLCQIKELIDIIAIASEQLACSWTMRDNYLTKHIRPVNLPKTQSVFPKPDFESAAKNYDGVFKGEDSLKQYLSPESYAPTPLVELPQDLNPFVENNIKIFAKFMPLVPLMNIKSLPAFSMLNEAYQRGDLKDVQNIIESSSSNTVMSLSIMAKLFGVEKTSAIVDHSISPGLLKMLQLFGVEILKHPSIGHELFGQVKPRRDRAERLGSQKGWFNPNQYGNEDNPKGFAKWLAPQIWNQTNGKIKVLALALGTCGTMVGVSNYLKDKNKEIEIAACCPASGHAVPGPREESLLKDVSFSWKDCFDTRVDLQAEESFLGSMQLLRRGIMGGPSSGMNYVGLKKHLAELVKTGKIDSFRNDTDGSVSAVFICCDSPLQHIDDYFEVLATENFPEIHEVEKDKL